MTWEVFLLLSLFGIKHFIADFPLQYQYMIQEKGIYGAGGGVQHAGIHAVGTFIVLMLVVTVSPWILFLSFVDGIVHYHIDWAKQQLNRNLTIKDDHWWTLMGLDQCLHYLTYVGIIYVVTS